MLNQEFVVNLLLGPPAMLAIVAIVLGITISIDALNDNQ